MRMSSAGKAASPTPLHHGVPASSVVQIVILSLLWGCNWPVLKLGVGELAPLTFRASSLAFAGIGLLLIAKFSGHSIRIPRPLWGKVVALALFNIAGWNGLILFGVQNMPAGRSAILAFTMPIWAVLIGLGLLHEPLSRRKMIGLALGTGGLAVLLSDDWHNLQRAPTGALFILGAAIAWAFGTVLLRRWKPPIPLATLTGWMMILGWIPIVLGVPFFDPHAAWTACKGVFCGVATAGFAVGSGSEMSTTPVATYGSPAGGTCATDRTAGRTVVVCGVGPRTTLLTGVTLSAWPAQVRCCACTTVLFAPASKPEAFESIPE